jgi:hypothetical protein
LSKPAKSTVLTLRVPIALDHRIEQEARRKRRSKSAILRDALQSTFGEGPPPDDPAREARRQSLLVSGRKSERDAMAFIESVKDERGWR